jgi:hypothetical protein
MTRRQFFLAPILSPSPAPLPVPVHLITDAQASWRPGQLRGFWSCIWPEAARDFGRCGIRLASSPHPGEVWRRPGCEPVVTGLEPGVVNLVVTDRIPIEWDNGLGLGGVTTLYHGRVLSMIALDHAHCHQVPLLSLNTCVHELLHVLLLDVYESCPAGLLGESREFRIDWYATRLWLFHDGAAVRRAAASCVDRLRAPRAAGRVSRSGTYRISSAAFLGEDRRVAARCRTRATS